MDNHHKQIDRDLESRTKVIELPEIMSTLVIFVVGMSLSGIVFVLEVIWAKYETRVKEWIELRKKIDLMKAIRAQNQGFVKERLFEFVE